MTTETYLELTYRHGKPIAGYLCLPRAEGDQAFRSRKARGGLIVDYASDGRPIGIEVTCPATITAAEINDLLAELKQEALGEEDLAPLLAS